MDSGKRSTLITLGAIVAGYAALRTVPSLLPEKLELGPMDMGKYTVPVPGEAKKA